ncbi:hypothetical protein MWU76_15450 [Gelidibacter sp. F2691]|nr:hypothetical protein [Gelidibacter sp. F2691]
MEQKDKPDSSPYRVPLNTIDDESTTDNQPVASDSGTVPTPQVGKKKFSERWKTSRFWLVRATYHVGFSIWAVVIGIGAVIAWIVAMLFI